ncbi:SusC/RagA family TonB-linked outer membrane protein [Flavitalea flava]
MKKNLKQISAFLPFAAFLAAAFLLFAYPSYSQQPQNTVTGKVVNKTGQGLENVSVTIKGSRTGTVTGADGTFTLRTDRSNAVLVFSLVGYLPVERPAAGNNLTVTLQETPVTLDSVIVAIGYGYQKRKDLTAAVGTVSGKEIRDLPVTNVQEALQGRIAGVQVIKPSGSPGASGDIIIRGLASLNNAKPLYVVDGVRSSGENFNVQDIASIDVIKDASAAAIYGSAAAGGVILITTKKGQKGKPLINFSARYGLSKPRIQQLLGKDDFIKLRREYDPAYLQGVNTGDLPNTNWTNAVYGNGTDEKYDLSVSGATENTNYLVSAFYNGQKGVYIDNSNYVSGARINSEFKLSKSIKVGEQLYVTQQVYNPTGFSTNPGDPNLSNPPNPPYRTIPIMGIYDPSNLLGGGWAKDIYGYQGGNLVGSELTYRATTRSLNLQGNIYAEVKLPFYLSFRTTFSYSPGYSTGNFFQDTYDFGAVTNTVNTLKKTSGSGHSLLSNYVLTFDHTFGRHAVTALAGYEQIATASDNISVQQTAQAQSGFNFFPTSGSTTRNPEGIYDPNGLIKSEFGRLNYNYDNKYYLSGTIRRDGNFTSFGPGNQYGVFPSVSGGWRVSEEPFFQGATRFVNELKLRGSYGVLGNSNIPGYGFLSTYELLRAQNFTPGDGSSRNLGYGITSLANKDIKWESLYETNIGLDAELLQNKLSFTFEWYDKTTKNMLYNVPVPASSGISKPYLTNIGSVNNKGVEIVLGYKDKAGEIGYSVNVNGAFNKNKVLNLDGVNKNPIFDGSNNIGGGYGVMNGYNLSITQVGHPFAEFYGYRSKGIYKDAQQIAANPQQVGKTANIGDLVYEDIDHNDTINNKDMGPIGNPNPKLVYGININLNWRGFDIALLFNGVAGVQLFNGLKPYNQYLFSDGNSTSAAFGASFLGSNALTGQPRAGVIQTGGAFLADPNGNYTTPSSYYVENGSYLKLKNLQLGYTFSGRLLRTAHIAGARLFVMTNNLFTITKYSGLDPELSGSVTSRGVDLPNQYPHTRIYSCGFSVTF